MNLFSQDDVEKLCRRVGFKAPAARIAGAIALCEAPYVTNGQTYSDFDSIGDQALANDTWGYSYGGFQVRSLRADKGTGRRRDELELLRPRFNAKSALIILRSQGWRAWSTYTNGMYKAYLQDMFPPEPGTYIVVAGDSLSTIATKIGGFTWEDLARVNNIHSPYSIYIGQTLVLPV